MSNPNQSLNNIIQNMQQLSVQHALNIDDSTNPTDWEEEGLRIRNEAIKSLEALILSKQKEARLDELSHFNNTDMWQYKVEWADYLQSMLVSMRIEQLSPDINNKEVS